MAKKVHKPSTVITNRRARFDYELSEDIVAGISLTGAEVRAARDGHVQLRGSYVQIRDHELWLHNASFSLALQQRGEKNARTVDTSPRKLLVSKKQIANLETERTAGKSIIPTKIITAGRYIKVVIALGKGKRHYDKRETLKRRDAEREAARQIKRY